MEATTKPSAGQIERELAEILDQERFEPPAEFREGADHRRVGSRGGGARPKAWWAKQAEALDWFERWDTVLDDSEAPFYKWFVGGRLNASYNARPARGGGPGRAGGFHWRGEEGEERDVTYAELLRDVKRLANALKDRGIQPGDVVGIYLPMIPEVVVAMLACARIGAPHNVVFGGFSPDAVKERMEFSEAKALITTDQARRKGKAADVKPAVDAFLDEVPSVETVVVVRNTGAEVDMTDGRDVFYDEAIEAASRTARPRSSTPSTRCSSSTRAARPPSRRASSTPPAATSRAWPGPRSTCSTSSRTRTCGGAPPTSAGSPATPTSSTGRSPMG